MITVQRDENFSVTCHELRGDDEKIIGYTAVLRQTHRQVNVARGHGESVGKACVVLRENIRALLEIVNDAEPAFAAGYDQV